MNFDDLRYFTSVAETGNVSRSAQLLNVSQPTISRSIIRLEKELSKSLFQREKNRLLMTPEGMDVYEKSSKIMDLYSQICGCEKKRVSFFVTEYCHYVLWHTFFSRHSSLNNYDLSIELLSQKEIKKRIKEGLCDVVTSSHPFVENDNYYTYELKEKMYLVCKKNSMWRQSIHSLDMLDYYQNSIITLGKSPSIRRICKKIFGDVNSSNNSVKYINDLYLLLSEIAVHDQVALLPGILCEFLNSKRYEIASLPSCYDLIVCCSVRKELKDDIERFNSLLKRDYELVR